jgi:NAD(P)-dependent dehydrogenase (short-subunit alcohol dehydrogenase family)
MRSKILVIGATGKHGNTGAIVVDRLISHGRDVRVLIRKNSERVDALRQKGAELVVGDLHDRSTLSAAVQGDARQAISWPTSTPCHPTDSWSLWTSTSTALSMLYARALSTSPLGRRSSTSPLLSQPLPCATRPM